jgi:hypothetical protein
MSSHTRRAFLSLAGGAIATAAIGALGAHFIDIAEAVPIAPDTGKLGAEIGTSSSLVTQVQWGWRRPRRRRWVCWWHRGRRRCGWRWV